MYTSVQNDRTLRDIVIKVIYPRHLAGYADLPVEVVVRAIRNWVAEGKTTPWTRTTWRQEWSYFPPRTCCRPLPT